MTALDQRGQYESLGTDDPTTYDVQSLADDVVEVAGAFGGPVHLVGHSFGGLVSRAAALTAPDALRSLTLLDSGAAAVAAPASNNLALLAQALPVVDLRDDLGGQAAARGTDRAGAADPRRSRTGCTAGSWPTIRPRCCASPNSCSPSRTASTSSPRLDLPLLVAYGETEDAWPPPLQEVMAERLGAAHIVISGAGHSPAADQPEVTAQVLSHFWAQVESG